MSLPTINYLYRYFCKTCEDFVFHKKVFSDEFNHELFSYCTFEGELTDTKPVLICTCCKTQYTPTPLDEVSDEKIKAQRIRYREYKAKEFAELTKYFTTGGGNIIADMFREPSNKFETKIIESDAGL